MRRIAATLAVLALLFSAGSAWADFDDSWAAYERGDYVTALQGFLPLAEQGDAKAQFQLGVMYTKGYAVSKNDAEAVRWYRKAAEQGLAEAQFNVGVMYALGRGVAVNKLKGYMWFSLAKAQGHEKAAKSLYIVKRKMSSADISKAQTLASEMWKKINN